MESERGFYFSLVFVDIHESSDGHGCLSRSLGLIADVTGECPVQMSGACLFSIEVKNVCRNILYF